MPNTHPATKAITGFAIARLIVGATFLVDPKGSMRRWVGPPTAPPEYTTAPRMLLGVRDVALSALTLRALHRGQSAAPWVALAGVAEAIDVPFAVSLVTARRTPSGQRTRAVVGPALLSVAGLALARWASPRVPTSR